MVVDERPRERLEEVFLMNERKKRRWLNPSKPSLILDWTGLTRLSSRDETDEKARWSSSEFR